MKKLSLILLALTFLTACASQPSDPVQAQAEQTANLKNSPNTWNSAPAEQFSAFGTFELKEVALAEALQSDPKKVQVATTAGAVISGRLQPLLDQWKQQSNGDRTLIITPTLTQFKIISKGARFWAGAFAGDSNARLEVTFTDKATGQTLASPFFFQNANAFASTWTFGSHDQSIPERLAVLFQKYMVDNYAALEGGPTGSDR